MLNYYFESLKNSYKIFNIFEYITFRAASASITALIICFFVGPWIIKFLAKRQIGEEIRSNGPRSHKTKQGTPSMGGFIILLAALNRSVTAVTTISGR